MSELTDELDLQHIKYHEYECSSVVVDDDESHDDIMWYAHERDGKLSVTLFDLEPWQVASVLTHVNTPLY